MTKNNKYQKISPETQDQAMKMAKATQRPGQTKEQTKLIAQGIEKGMNHYKKQHKIKSRELNKKRHKVTQSLVKPKIEQLDVIEKNSVCKQPILPWVLLTISWIGFMLFVFRDLIQTTF